MSNNDVQAVGEIFDVMSAKVPKMIGEILKQLYSEETGRQMGKAVGVFYKEIVASGIPKEDALEMAKDYLNTLKQFAPDNIIQADAKK